MKKETINHAVLQPIFTAQSRTAQIRALLETQMRDSALAFVNELFHDEIEKLCGRAFVRKGDAFIHRAGSDPGSVLVNGQRLKVKKPRAKKNGKDEQLESYQALQGYDLLSPKVMSAMMSGVSTRRYDELLDEYSGGLGLPKSTVSKAFKMASQAKLDEINSRSLELYRFVALMIDGIEFAGRVVIVAMGITIQGKKLILGLKEGSTEHSEVCKDLLNELVDRKLKIDDPFLLVLDGSKALRKACRQVFGDRFPVQRCVRHKERNITEYLSKEHHAEFKRRWKLIHGAVDYIAAKAEYDRLSHWLSKINHEAHSSLKEADGETLTVVGLQCGHELRKTLLSTNPIESIFNGVRSETRRIKNWKSGKNQIMRWSASALLDVEKRIRRVRGHGELKILIERIRKMNLQNEQQAA